jgi:hypothetical protein
MSRTSRCFAEIFLQLGGPGTLSSAARNLYQFHFADFSFSASAHIALRSLAKLSLMLGLDFTETNGGKLFPPGPQNSLSTLAVRLASHKLGRNLAAQLAAIG